MPPLAAPSPVAAPVPVPVPQAMMVHGSAEALVSIERQLAALLEETAQLRQELAALSRGQILQAPIQSSAPRNSQEMGADMEEPPSDLLRVLEVPPASKAAPRQDATYAPDATVEVPSLQGSPPSPVALSSPGPEYPASPANRAAVEALEADLEATPHPRTPAAGVSSVSPPAASASPGISLADIPG